MIHRGAIWKSKGKVYSKSPDGASPNQNPVTENVQFDAVPITKTETVPVISAPELTKTATTVLETASQHTDSPEMKAAIQALIPKIKQVVIQHFTFANVIATLSLLVDISTAILPNSQMTQIIDQGAQTAVQIEELYEQQEIILEELEDIKENGDQANEILADILEELKKENEENALDIEVLSSKLNKCAELLSQISNSLPDQNDTASENQDAT